ncbi:MAG TPA: hypothetical protein VF484_02550 [Candidatus Limnocylindrales bacterium]
MDTTRDTDRTRRRAVAAAVLLGLAFATAACSSSGSGGTPGSAATATAAGATAGAEQPTEQPAATSTPGSASGAVACDLVTAAEMATAIGSQPLTTKVVPGPPDTCSYTLSGDDAPTVAVVVTPGGGVAYDAIAQDPSSTSYPGIGDKAVYYGDGQTFMVLKGGTLVTIAVNVTDDKLPGARPDVLKQIAAIAAGRM